MVAQTAAYVEKELGLNFDQIFENTQTFFDYPFVK
jgi:hypothetical protein